MQRTQGSPASAVTAPTNNLLGRTGFEKDYLYRAQGRRAFVGDAVRLQWQAKQGALVMDATAPGKAATARFTSDVISCRFPATEFLPSWNIRLPRPDHGFRLYMRVHGEEGTRPSSWLLVGEGGKLPSDDSVKIKSPGWGATRIDYLDLQKPALAFQYRVDFFISEPAQSIEDRPALCRFFVHYSGAGNRSRSAKPEHVLLPGPTRVSVPYRSQLVVEKEELRNHICCPTSLAMVLQHHGINKPTLDVCALAYDARYDIYGVWPNVSHVAFQHGLKSWIHRFRSHSEVYDYLQSGHPIIASIRVGEGELRGARYLRSNGHIIVITGMRKNGNYIVNDPASAGPKGAAIDYFAQDMEKVWLDKGGVAILIKPENTK